MQWDMTHKDWIEMLKPHAGHQIECHGYEASDGECYWIECRTCNQTLIDTDDYKDEEE